MASQNLTVNIRLSIFFQQVDDSTSAPTRVKRGWPLGLLFGLPFGPQLTVSGTYSIHSQQSSLVNKRHFSDSSANEITNLETASCLLTYFESGMQRKVKCLLANVLATTFFPDSLHWLFRYNTSMLCRLDDVVNRSSAWNRINPVIKNTVRVPVDGYVVVRFISNNPGVWSMHCHQETPSALGMMMAWNEAPEHHPSLPPGFDACDDFKWTAEQLQDYLQPKLHCT